MNATLQSLSRSRDAALGEYAAFVDDAAAGIDLEATAVRDVLHSAGKSEDDFRGDVERKARRMKAASLIDQAAAERAERQATLDAEADRLRDAFDAEQDESRRHLERMQNDWTAARNERDSFRSKTTDLQSRGERILVQTADPSIDAEIHRLTVELQRIQGERFDRENPEALAAHDAKVQELQAEIQRLHASKLVA